MAAFREFEIQAIRLLAADKLTDEQITLLSSLPDAANYSYTGCGYFLTVSHPALPAESITLSSPAVIGTVGEITSGFVVFLRDHELTLECHTWGATEVPSNFRNLAVSISRVSLPSAVT